MLSKAPLIEVIFELKWGRQTDTGELSFEADERSFFAGQFKKSVESIGFPHVERVRVPGTPVNIPFVDIPFFASHRFRPAQGKWPCYQIGLGLFTVNVTNHEYAEKRWDGFIDALRKGLEALDASHPVGIHGLPFLNVNLVYIDGLCMGEGDDPLQFMKRNLETQLVVPQSLLAHERLEDKVLSPELSFALVCRRPPGKAMFKLNTGEVNGKAAYISQTRVCSEGPNCPEQNTEALLTWASDAHRIQQHVFRNFISKAHMETYE